MLGMYVYVGKKTSNLNWCENMMGLLNIQGLDRMSQIESKWMTAIAEAAAAATNWKCIIMSLNEMKLPITHLVCVVEQFVPDYICVCVRAFCVWCRWSAATIDISIYPYIFIEYMWAVAAIQCFCVVDFMCVSVYNFFLCVFSQLTTSNVIKSIGIYRLKMAN